VRTDQYATSPAPSTAARTSAAASAPGHAVLRRGFLYEPVSDMRFDVILSNPPVSAGMKIVLPIIEQAPSHLAEHGIFQIVVRSKIGGKRLLKVVEETFGTVEVLARKSGYRVLMSKKP
jgi:16S rRNA (guanine1207-N2)-methyltransferase